MSGNVASQRGRLVLRGHLPLIALAAAIAVIVAAVPAQRQMAPATVLGVQTTPQGGPAAPAQPRPDGAAPSGATLGATCEGGVKQTKEPYSPPCILFHGDNGGATSPGVTREAITVTFREGNLPSLYAVAGSIAQKLGVKDTGDDVRRTIRTYFDYFNSHFQLYGRKAVPVFYKGVGDQLQEFFGANPEGAQADALTVGKELKAFADESALTTPYAEALARQKVIAMPPVHMSARWYREHAPYTWGVLVDCSQLVRTLVDWATKRVLGQPARYAGNPEFRTKTRTLGLIVPEQPWYQECAAEGVKQINAAGFKFDHQINYPLDFNRLSIIAPSIIAQMKARGVTTVACVCDPVLPLFLTGQATQQGYFPEWVVAGSALTDVDVLGQIYDKAQWKNAFGLSFLSDIYHGMKAESYRTYKAMRQDEPAFIADVLYYPILMLFLGIHMAGPNLNPTTFQQGLFHYPPTVGETGRWSFGPDDYTATDDAREIYFDPSAMSPFDNAPGKYQPTMPGQRFSGATWPNAPLTIPGR